MRNVRYWHGDNPSSSGVEPVTTVVLTTTAPWFVGFYILDHITHN